MENRTQIVKYKNEKSEKKEIRDYVIDIQLEANK